MSVSEGQLLAGKYRIERVLGQGGMGVVVAAHHIVLDEVVAIKFLLPEALGSAEAVARFEREARAAVKIKSEHVARVTDVGRLENGAPYMVMELLRGRDLGDLLQQNGPLALGDMADYVLQAGEAIAEAHGLGIVHRDLKPPNLFLTTRADGSSCVKVLDFGISKLINASSSGDHAMTSTTAVMGSPLYMSPEQLLSARDVDMRTDIWALGVICFELLTGKLPFQGETLPQLCMAISLNPPTPLRNYRPDLPLEVEAMLLRCLSKDPGKRYATVAAFAAELVKFAPRHARLSAERIERLARAAGFSASALALPPSSDNTAAAQTADGHQTIGGFGRTKPGAPASKLRLGLVVGGLLALAGVGAFALHRTPAPDAGGHGGPPLPPEPTTVAPPLVTPDPTPSQQVPPSATTPPVDSGVVPPPPPSSDSHAQGQHGAGVKSGTVKSGAQTGSKLADSSKLANQGKPPVTGTPQPTPPVAPPSATTPVATPSSSVRRPRT
ncbi:MAG TPA: serine/threonine-protein kinase [Polyangiaceae bacterium]|nr:serine/threonine-protein kinase [Polyangiaceae bacterium]